MVVCLPIWVVSQSRLMCVAFLFANAPAISHAAQFRRHCHCSPARRAFASVVAATMECGFWSPPTLSTISPLLVSLCDELHSFEAGAADDDHLGSDRNIILMQNVPALLRPTRRNNKWASDNLSLPSTWSRSWPETPPKPTQKERCLSCVARNSVSECRSMTQETFRTTAAIPLQARSR